MSQKWWTQNLWDTVKLYQKENTFLKTKMKYKGIYYFKKLEPRNKQTITKIFKATVK